MPIPERRVMMDYKLLYALMVSASEQAIGAIEQQNDRKAKEILIAAEQKCEEIFVSVSE